MINVCVRILRRPYRIDTQRELETLALDDLRDDKSILLIEWGEKFPRLVRERDVEIALERLGENERRIRVSEGGRFLVGFE